MICCFILRPILTICYIDTLLHRYGYCDIDLLDNVTELKHSQREEGFGLPEGGLLLVQTNRKPSNIP